MGPPMSWTTRWNRSSPSAPTAARANQAEAGPAVVEVRWPLGEVETGQVERDAPKSAGSKLADKFALQE